MMKGCVPGRWGEDVERDGKGARRHITIRASRACCNLHANFRRISHFFVFTKYLAIPFFFHLTALKKCYVLFSRSFSPTGVFGMARQEIKEDGVEESAKRMETLGYAFPGLAPVIDGVNVHKLALGHLADFVAIAIAFEIEKAKKKAAYGISAKDEEEKHRAAQATGAAG